MDLESSAFEHNTINVSFEEIQELSCVGATSVSFKARLWGKWLFLKRPKPEYANNPKYIAAFEKEFDLGIHLDHSHIIRYHSKGHDSQGMYILTEFVDGITLTEYIRTHPKLAKHESRQLIEQIADALRYLHARQIVHFDLKPDNILITTNGHQAKLVDLGFAYSDCYAAIACGTRGYSAPEQFTAPESADLHADIFALGSVIKFITPAFPKIVRRATRPNPADRYPNADALMRDMRPSRWGWWISGGVVVVMCGFFIWQNFISQPQTPLVVTQRDTVVLLQQVGRSGEETHEKIQNQNAAFERNLRIDLQRTFQPVATAFFRENPVMTKECEQEVRAAFISCRHHLDSLASQIYSRYNPNNSRDLFWLWRICEDEVRAALLPFKKISGDFIAHETFINQYKTALYRGYERIFDSVYYSHVPIGSVREENAYKQALVLKEQAQREAFIFQDSVVCEYARISPSDSTRFLSEAAKQMCIALEYHDRIVEHYKKHYQNR